jgi:hypothetical protein
MVKVCASLTMNLFETAEVRTIHKAFGKGPTEN